MDRLHAKWEVADKSIRVVGSEKRWGAPNAPQGGVCNILGAGYAGTKMDPLNVEARDIAAHLVAMHNAWVDRHPVKCECKDTFRDKDFWSGVEMNFCKKCGRPVGKESGK